MTLALLSASLMACSPSSRGATVLPRTIPPAPAYLQPVHVATPKLGEDPYQIAARERAGRLQANRVIAKAATEWNMVAADLAATP